VELYLGFPGDFQQSALTIHLFLVLDTHFSKLCESETCCGFSLRTQIRQRLRFKFGYSGQTSVAETSILSEDSSNFNIQTIPG